MWLAPIALKAWLLTLCLVVGIYVEPSATNYRHFFVKIAGPPETPYQGGMFDCELFLPEEYPMVPPKVLFRTKIYHPNIDKLGKALLHSSDSCNCSAVDIWLLPSVVTWSD